MLCPPALEETVTEPLDPVALVFVFIVGAYFPVFELKESVSAANATVVTKSASINTKQIHFFIRTFSLLTCLPNEV